MITRISLVFFVSACAGFIPPKTHEFQNFVFLEASFDVVWEELNGLFEQYQWPIEESDSQKGTILSIWVKDKLEGGDFGIGPMVSEDLAEMAVSAQVVRVSPERTRVRVHCFFRAKLLIEGRKYWSNGTSRGVVEKKVLDLLKSKFTLFDASG